MTLRLAIDAPWPNGYSSAAVREPWQPGEVREVDAEAAAYLLSTFPGVFSEAPAPEATAGESSTEDAPTPTPDTPRRRRG